MSILAFSESGTSRQGTLTKRLIANPARHIKMALSDLKTKYNFARRRYGFAPAETIFFISPNEIEWHTDRPELQSQDLRDRNFETQKYKGKVVAGNWDSKLHRFSELAVYQAIRARIEQSTPWESTSFFAESLTEIESGRHLWGCSNRAALVKRCEIIDQIIDDVRMNGFKSGFNSRLPHEDPASIAKRKGHSEEITVNIGRCGDFFFQDGRHRLAIAKVLGVREIPVKVLVRHQLWCEKLLGFALGDIPKHLITHPEIQLVLKQGMGPE